MLEVEQQWDDVAEVGLLNPFFSQALEGQSACIPRLHTT